MKRQITQFDNDRSNATIATPTCSSCCCCCCCLTTTLTSSTILARRINKEAVEKKVKDRYGLAILSALFLPVVGLLTYLIVFAINKDFTHCAQQTYTYTSGSYSYESCSNPADNLWGIIPIALIVSVLILCYLYMRVKMGRPLLRAVIVTLIISVAFTVEFIGGALLILSTAGIGYIIMIPILYIAAQRFYSKHFLKQTIFGNKVKPLWG